MERSVPRWEIILGQLTLALWMLSVWMEFELSFLREVQSNPIAKVISGLVLFVGLSLQGAYSFKRIFPESDVRNYIRKMLIHRRIGNYLPIALLLHASGFGYGLNLLLTCILLLNMAQGWWGTKSKGGWYIKAVGVHVVLGISLYALAIYHAVIALIFHMHI